MEKLKTYFTLIVISGVIGYWGYIFISRGIKNYLLANQSSSIKAVVSNDKNYMGNSPVSHQFSYSYEFYVKGEAFTGDSHDPELQIGDTILVRYVSSWPSINEPVDNKGH